MSAENEADELLAAIAQALSDVYDPAGMLMFWSLRVSYLENRRPCDIWRTRDIAALRVLAQRTTALADGAFA